MRQLFLVMLFFMNYNIYSQSILTVLNFNKKNEFNSENPVLETTTQTTFFNTNRIERKKDVQIYNEKNEVTSELRYDENGDLKQRLTRVYDSTGTRCLSRKIENWHPLLGHSYDTYYYGYDNKGFLNSIIEKDQNGKIVRKTIIINNDKGNPTELMLLIGNQVQGKEIAKYDYEKNEVTIQYFNKNDEIINSQKSKIEFSKSQPGDIVNEHGDVIKSIKFEMRIKYDKFGNWIKKVYYRFVNGKAIKESESTRAIKYGK
jgi:hypothetical protein